MTVELQQVWYDIENDEKFVVRKKDISKVRDNPDEYIYIAETPHSEKNNKYGGIYSYFCDCRWCRCQS